MKRIVFIFIVVLLSFSSYAQTYTITAKGYIGSGPSSCGSNNNGLKWIKLYFSDGTNVDLFRQDRGQFRNQDYTFSKTYDVSKKLVRARFRTVSRSNSWKGCKSSKVAEKSVTITSPCFYKYYGNTEVYRDDINGWVSISVVPNINLTFDDGSSATSIYSGCKDGSIDINATAGHTPKNEVYTWEFFDPVNTETRNHPAYQVLVNAERTAQSAYRSCVRQNGDPDRCIRQEAMWRRAQQELRSYSGPRTIQVSVWRPIPSQTGNSEIKLKLSDLYASISDRNKAVNKNIDVRLKPSCNAFNAITNQVTIQYLPAAPSISRAPQIAPLTCSYSTTAGFTLFFDRQIYDFEAVDINLLRKLDNDVRYEAYDNNTNIRSLGSTGSGNFSYVWRPSSGQEIKKGSYKIQVSGYSRGGDRTAPFCKAYEYSFDVNAPSPVDFTAISVQDQKCFGVNDGEVEINITSGGTGTYQYSLNSGGWVSFTGPRVIIGQLAPRQYNIKVRKSNGCLAINPDGSTKTINSVINATTQITHQLGAVTPPGSSGANDGKIVVQRVNGGTPFKEGTRDYYNATVLINGSTTNTKTYRAYANGFDIDGLPAGAHKIRYTDSKGCVVEIDLPRLTNPLPISFSLQKQDPSCSDASDGRLTAVNISGGYPPYTITWRKNNSSYGTGTSVTGDQGNYEVIVTDARSGRAEQRNIRFDNVPLPIAISNINVLPIACYGQQATVTVSATGGSGAYQYAIWTGTSTVWQNSSVFALGANTTSGYLFRVRDRNSINCISGISNRQLINQPSEIIVTTRNVVNNTVFEGNQGAIEINTTGGSPNYTITWERNGTTISNTGTSISNLVAGRYVAIVQDASGCIVRSSDIEVTEPDELLVSINETIIIPCNGGIGTLSAIVSGGSTNYTYQWYKDGVEINGEISNTLTNVVAGNYSVLVGDGYTSKTAAIAFTEPASVDLSISGVNISCFNENTGRIVLNPQGGTRPYSFSIDNKATYISENDLTNLTIDGLSSGLYEVWLRDANGCEINASKSVTLTQPSEIVITETSLVDVTIAGGNNGSIGISVAGGVGSHTFIWTKQGDAGFNSTTKDINNLSFGLYTVSVTDQNNCIVQRTFEVREPLPIGVQISITNPILCYEDTFGELLATVSGGFPIVSTPTDFEYRWYRVEANGDVAINSDFTIDSLKDLGAGRYKVVVTDSQGSSAERTLDLTQPDDLVVTLSGTPTQVLCHGEATGAIDITVLGGPKDANTGVYLPYTFVWTKVGDASFNETTEDLQNITAGTYEVVVIDDNLCTTSLSQSVEINQPAAPLEISNIVVTNLTGYQTGNGSIVMDVSGGTPPYSYSWINLEDVLYSSSDEDLFNLTKGNYQLSITDSNGCTLVMTQEVTEPEELRIAITPLTTDQEIKCFGERTLVPLVTTTTGGVGTYTYRWYAQNDPNNALFTTANTPTTLLAGDYRVEVTDINGNRDSTTYTVSEPLDISLSALVSHLRCAKDTNGEIDITVQGGVPPYSYLWSNGESTEDLTGIIAGNYSVTVTDFNGCIYQTTIEVEQPPALFVNGDIIRLYPSSNGVRDGSITVTIGGGILPYRYEWRDFNNVLQSSTTNVLANVGVEKYSLTITDANGCILAIDDVDLFEPPALEVTILQVNVVSCYGNTTTGSISARAQGGRPFNNLKQYDYQWFNASTNQQIGLDNYLLENIGAGRYYVIVSDAAGRTARSPEFELEQPEQLEILFATDYVSCGDGNDWTIIPSINGGTSPYQYQWNTGEITDRLENVIAGTYSVEVLDSRGCSVTNQITVSAPSPLQSTETLTIPTCYNGCDGSILLETEGGTPPYTYQWSTGNTQEDQINVCSGVYTVIVTDSKGCQITKEITLGSPEELIVNLGEDVTLCKDQSIVLNATITDPNATYLWTSVNGFSSVEAVIEISEPSIYEVVVTDSKGCVATDNIFVDKVTNVISAQFFASTQVFVGEKFVLVDNSDPIPDTVDWIFPEGAEVTFEDDNYAEAIFNTPGEYEITLQTYLGLCTAVTTKKIIVVDKEFEGGGEGDPENTDITSHIDYLVYPNPTNTGRFKVDVNLSKSQNISLKIFNMVNNSLINSKSGEGKDTYTFDYDMSILPSGIYFILLETSSASQVRKLIID